MGPVDLSLAELTAHALNGVVFSKVGVDPDGLPYAVLAEDVPVSELDGESLLFTYTGPQVDRQSEDRICFLLAYEPPPGAEGVCGPEYAPAFRQWYPAPYHTLGPNSDFWDSPFSDEVSIGGTYAGGYWCPQVYSVVIGWARVAGNQTVWGERFRVKGLRCTGEGQTVE